MNLIKNEFEKNVPSLVLCSNSFHKIEFLNKIIISEKNPIIFVDMDLLYSGYIESKMIEQKENLMIFRPNKDLIGKKDYQILFVKFQRKNF